MLRSFFDFLAKLGLVMRDDRPKVVDLSVRDFGEPEEGLALSIRQIARDDPDALVSVSVVIRNVSPQPKSFTIPGWLAFYRFEVRLSDGWPATLTPFGRALAKPQHGKERIDATLQPGALHETEVPLGSIFHLLATGRYTVKAFAEPLDGVALHSNTITVPSEP